MHISLYTSFLILVAAPLMGSPDNAAIGTPDLGLVYDSGRRVVRAIHGTLGAALFSGGLSIDFRPVALAGAGGTLLLVAPGDGTIQVATLKAQTIELTLIKGAITGADRVVLSPSGDAALLCDSKTGLLQVITGLPGSPQVGNEVHFQESGAAGWKLAIADSGSRFGIASGNSVWLFEPAAGWADLRLPADITAVTFVPRSTDPVLLLASGELFRAGSSGMEAFGVIAGAAGFEAVGLQVSTDGRRAYVAYGQGTLVVAEAGSPEAKLTSCECAPAGLIPANRPGLYRLNEVSDSPLLFWDVSRATRVWFVPNGVPGDEE